MGVANFNGKSFVAVSGHFCFTTNISGQIEASRANDYLIHTKVLYYIAIL